MRIDQMKLICIKDKESETWCVYPKDIPNLIVQVTNIDDAPKELAKSFEVMMMYNMRKKDLCIKFILE